MAAERDRPYPGAAGQPRFAPLVAHDNAALIETLELAFERLQME